MRSKRACACARSTAAKWSSARPGPTRVQQVIREALARGADRAIHVEDAALGAADAFAAAAALAPAMAEEQFDLILTGLQSDDQGHAQFGPVLATRLGVPHSTIIMEVQVDPTAKTLRVKRELEGGWFQYVGMPLPALLTIQSGINQLRYATLKGIMAAKKKEIKKVAAAAPVAAASRSCCALRAAEGEADGDDWRLGRRKPRRSWSSGCAKRRGSYDSRRRRTERRQAQSRELGSHRRRPAAGASPAPPVPSPSPCRATACRVSPASSPPPTCRRCLAADDAALAHLHARRASCRR